jgi:hypothetical protein
MLRTAGDIRILSGWKMMRRASKAVAFIIVSAMISAQAQTFTEYQVKAAHIFNFARFVEWPSPVESGSNVPMVVGILGVDPFGRDIENALDGKTAKERRLVIRRFPNLQSLAPCHILFVSSSQKHNLRQIFAAVAGSNVLTVGETDRFAESGGVIQISIVDGKAQLVINLAAAERAGLKISSKLLGLARVIRD